MGIPVITGIGCTTENGYSGIELEMLEHQSDAKAGAMYLLKGLNGTEKCRDACTDLLYSQDPANTIYILVDLSSRGILRHRTRTMGGEGPKHVTVLTPHVHLYDSMKTTEYVDADRVSITEVDNLSNLDQLFDQIEAEIETWEESSFSTSLCFHSLTSIVPFHSQTDLVPRLERFAEQLERTSTEAHFHINPAAHPDETLTGLEQTFESSVAPHKRQDQVLQF